VNRGATDVTISNVDIQGFDNPGTCTASTIAKNGVFSCNATGSIPKNAKLSEPYFTDTYWKNPASNARNNFDPSVPFGLPFAPTPYRAVFTVKAGTVQVTRDLPIEYRYIENIYFGDKRMELTVVPAFSVRVTPALAIVPAAAA